MKTNTPTQYEGYTEHKGFYFKDGTPDKVMRIIADHRRTGTRLRLWYGDTETGKPWQEEHDIIGHIGRSTGSKRIALLLANSRSHGGGGSILTDCIVAIQFVQNKEYAYKHEGFNVPEYTIKPREFSGLELDRRYGFEVHDAEAVAARFETRVQAERWVKFMRGERMAK